MKLPDAAFDSLVTIDMETFYSSDYSLKKLTTEAYVRGGQFQVIGVGVKVGGHPSVWLEEADFRAWAARVNWSAVTLLAHHAHFDGLILSHHYGIKPGKWRDTLSMARALHGTEVGGSLAVLAEHYGLGKKGDEVVNALGKRRADFSAEEWLRYGAYCNNDVELTAKLFAALLPGFPAAELDVVDMTVRGFTEPVFVANQAVLRAASEEEARKKAASLARVRALTGEDPRAVLASTPKFVALLRRLGVEVPTKPNAKGNPIPALSKADAGMHQLLEHESQEVRDVCAARLEVKSTIVGTRTERMLEIASRGPVPFYLKAYGAHTHRWSGGDKMNPQNFNRGGALRAAIEAPPGHVLVVADSGQIEARVLPWLAGQADLLETFRRNDAMGEAGDFYSDEGSAYFQKKISKKTHPVERQTSKSMVLGLGFGMGWKTFAANLLKGMLGAPPVQFTDTEATAFGVDVPAFERGFWGNGSCGDAVEDLRMTGNVRLPYAAFLTHCAVTKFLVDRYRAKNHKINKLWKSCDALLPVMETRGASLKFGCLDVAHEAIRKPSGLVLRYPGIRKGSRGYSYASGDPANPRANIYGGLLTENLVQSLARDIVAEQALRIRAAGFHIGTTTHDEIVAVVPKAKGAECLDLMLREMRTPPAWCADLPLNASGDMAVSYGDCK